MKTLRLALPLFFLLLISPLSAQTLVEAVAKVKPFAVSIKPLQGIGSGVLITRKVDDKIVNFVWTAGHVVEDNRIVTKVGEKETVDFSNVLVLKEVIEKGKPVESIKVKANIIKYSPKEEQDLALLQLSTSICDSSIDFESSDEPLALGTELFHIGSLNWLEESLTVGHMSGVRDSEGRAFDQVLLFAVKGSSGGGVFLRNGKYVGMVTHAIPGGMNMVVPIRRMREFAKLNDLLWAIDNKPVTELELKMLKVE